jgi:L-alanine-DL-glutamate epimerase-like enolase superfamily enzyme
MKLQVQPLRLRSRHPFKIARNTRTEFELFIFSLTYGDITGIGEAAPQRYYGESPETVLEAVETVGPDLDGDPDALLESLNENGGLLREALAGHASVRAAIDMALWDIKGKLENRPCYELFGAEPGNTPLTSYTIGIDTPDVIDEKVDAARQFKILKVKVGVPGDMEILDRVLARSGKKVRVDANEGWDIEMAISKSRELSERGVEFCEQPVSHEDEEGLRELKRVSQLEILLDESIVNPGDVEAKNDQGHGINIKLMKCGGISPALDLIAEARRYGLKVMLGCMLETSVAVTAAAHLSPLVDYADLDGNLLLEDDPFKGVEVIDGRLVLPKGPGLGITRAGT